MLLHALTGGMPSQLRCQIAPLHLIFSNNMNRYSHMYLTSKETEDK